MCAACVLGATLLAQKTPPAASSADLVELDIVVLDKDEHPVAGLRQEDFQIKEDGHVVDVKTFSHVTARRRAGRCPRRDAAMDDVGVSITGTSTSRPNACWHFPSRGSRSLRPRTSRVSSAIPSNVRRDVTKIARGGSAIPAWPSGRSEFLCLESLDRQVKHVVQHRRKVIICLGMSVVCDVEDPPLGAHSVLWPHWVAAIGAAARANVSVYAVDPTGLNQRSGARGIGWR